MILFSIRYKRLWRKLNNAKRMMSLSDGSAERYTAIGKELENLGHEYIKAQTMKGKPECAGIRKNLKKVVSQGLRTASADIDKVAIQSLTPRFQHKYYRRYESMN